MAFTPFDPDAPTAADNAYITLAEFKSWHTDRNVTQVVEGEYTDNEIQSAIINATDYIDKRFGRKFRGYRKQATQGLEWPRSDAYDNDNYLMPGKPRQLIAGTAEYALLTLQLGRNLAPPVTPGFGVVDPATGGSTSEAGGQVTEEFSKVGPIEKRTRFEDSASSSQSRPATSSGSSLTQSLPEYPQADLWLEELLKSSMSRRLVRGG